MQHAMWPYLIVLLVALVIHVTPTSAQPVHQHIPIIPDDLLPPQQHTTYTTTPPFATTTTTATTARHTQQSTLAYLTPWNRGGYDTSLNYSHKFTHLSPVWFQIKLTSHPSKEHNNRNTLAILITGEHDVDTGWMESVRAAGSGVRIVPRFIVEMSSVHVLKLMKTDKMHRQLYKRLTEVVDRYGLDGVVLECSDMHAIARREQKDEKVLVAQANTLLRTIGAALHAHQPRLLFILVVRPPFPRSPYFGAKDYQAVREQVDYFSLMTYDFSSGQEQPGPNSPLSWARQSMYGLIGERASEAEKAKVLMGVNMYGMRWKVDGRTGEAILGREYVEVVEKAEVEGRVIRKWEEESSELRTEVEGEAVMYYPNSKSVERRVQLANREGCGLSLWEIGQGLPELYEQL